MKADWFIEQLEEALSEAETAAGAGDDLAPWRFLGKASYLVTELARVAKEEAA